MEEVRVIIMPKKKAKMSNSEILSHYRKIQKNNSRAGKISSNSLTPEQRHERAIKAVKAREAKKQMETTIK